MQKQNRGQLKRLKRLQQLSVAALPTETVGATGKLRGTTRRGDALPLAGKHVTIVSIEPDKHGGSRVGVEFKSNSRSHNVVGYAEVPLCDVVFGPVERPAHVRVDPYEEAVRLVDSASSTTLPQGQITPEIVAPIVASQPVAERNHPAFDAVEKRLRLAMLNLERSRRDLNAARSEYSAGKCNADYMRALASAVSCVNQRDQYERTARLQAEPFRLMPFEAPPPEKPRPVAKARRNPIVPDVWRLWSVFAVAEREAYARSARAAWARKQAQAAKPIDKSSQLVAHNVDRLRMLKAASPRNSFTLKVEETKAGLPRTSSKRWGLK